MTLRKPAPWTLGGEGYIIAYKFSKNFVEKNGFISENLKKSFDGGIGFVMIVDYKYSDVGPYNELLFIPGRFNFPSKKTFSITKIFVSKMESVYNGKLNWGIPKDLGEFQIKKIDENEERVIVSKSKSKFMDITLRKRGPSIPITTRILPFSSCLGHERLKKVYYTKLRVSGKIKSAKILDVSVNNKYFPDISNIDPIFAIRIEDFKMKFEKAEIEKK